MVKEQRHCRASLAMTCKKCNKCLINIFVEILYKMSYTELTKKY